MTELLEQTSGVTEFVLNQRNVQTENFLKWKKSKCKILLTEWKKSHFLSKEPRILFSPLCIKIFIVEQYDFGGKASILHK